MDDEINKTGENIHYTIIGEIINPYDKDCTKFDFLRFSGMIFTYFEVSNENAKEKNKTGCQENS